MEAPSRPLRHSLRVRLGIALGIAALVVAPAATLIVLGARGLRRERAQRDAEQRQAIRALGDEAARRLRGLVDAYTGAFAEQIASAPTSSPALGATLASWAETQAGVGLAFVAAPDGMLLAPRARPIPPQHPRPAPPALARLLARLRREIVALGRATSTPDALIEEAASTASAHLVQAESTGQVGAQQVAWARADLGLALAGAYAERGDLGQALATYERLAAEESGVTTGRDVPVVLRARLAASALAARRGDLQRAVAGALAVETDLALGRYAVPRPVREGLLFSTRRLLDRARAEAPRDPALAHALARGEDRLECLRRFLPVYLRSVAPELGGLWRRGGPLRLAPRAEGAWHYVFCQRIPDSDRTVAGFSLSVPRLLADAATQLEGLAVGARGRLRVLDPQGVAVLTVPGRHEATADRAGSTAHLREQRPISDVLPGFALEVEAPAGLDKTAGGEGQLRLQAAALTGAALLLAFGLVLTVGASLHRVRLARLRSELVRNVSHELRTPLTTIRMYGEILRDGGLGEAQQGEYFEVIVTESERLQAMIESVLDFARLERGSLSLERRLTALAPLTREVVEAFRPRLEREGFTVSFEAADDLGPVAVDPVAIRRVVWNLVANAAAYSHETRRVAVRVDAKGTRARITVMDRGAGMPPEVQRRLFTPFFRAEAVAGTKRPAGIGLGLTLSRELMRLHGGGIDVASEVGVGSTVTAWLPASAQDEGESDG